MARVDITFDGHNRGALAAARGTSTAIEGVATSAKRTNRELGVTERQLQQTVRGAVAGSGAFRGLGRTLAFASGGYLGAAGLVAGIKASVNAASNQVEQTNKLRVVLGQSADALISWSKTTANAYGLASDQALQFAGTFAAFLRPMGVSQAKAAEVSKTLTGLGADLASFFNTDVDSALQAIQSGLVGQVRPLRAYGVSLSDARVQAEAFASGLAKPTVSLEKVRDANTAVAIAQAKLTKAQKDYGPGTTQVASATLALHSAQEKLGQSLAGNKTQLTDEQKLLARVAIILKDTALAQGDFNRTRDEHENLTRGLHALWRDESAIIGKSLIPEIDNVEASLTKWLSSSENQAKVQHAVEGAVNAVTGAVKTAVPIIERMWHIADNVAHAVGGWKHAIEILLALKFVSIIGQWTAAIAGPQGLLANLRLMTKNPWAVKVTVAMIGAELVYEFAKWLDDRFATNTQTKATKQGAVRVGDAKKGGYGVYYDPDTGKYETGGASIRGGKTKDLIPISEEVAASILGVTIKQLGKKTEQAVAVAASSRPVTVAGGGLLPPTTLRAAEQGRGGKLLQGEHATDGLPGFPAVDIKATPGQGVAAPEDGQLVSIRGHDPATGSHGAAGVLGYSLYFVGAETGTTYYMTHLLKVAPEGSYKKGEIIALVAAHPRGTHLHIGYHSAASGAFQVPRSSQPSTMARGTTGAGPTLPGTVGPQIPADAKTAAGAAETTPTPPSAISTQVVGKVSVGIAAHKRGGAALPAGWAENVLDGLGAPHTPGNIAFLQAWQRREGGSTENTATFNPLCTTMKGYGGVSVNKDGVKAYPSWDQGLQATIATILLYKGITQALRSGAIGKNFRPTAEFAKEFSRWSKGGYTSIGVGDPDLVAGDGSLVVGEKPGKAPKTDITQLTPAQRLAINRLPGGQAGLAGQRSILGILLKKQARKGLTPDEKADLAEAIRATRENIASALKELGDAAQEAADARIQKTVDDLKAHPEKGPGLAAATVAHFATLDPRVRAAITNAVNTYGQQLKAALKQARPALGEGSSVLDTLLGFDQSTTITSQDKFGRAVTTTIGAVVAKVRVLLNNLEQAMASGNVKAVQAAVQAWEDFAPMVSDAVQAGMDAAQQKLQSAQSSFETMFGRVSSMVLTAFDRETSAHIAAMQASTAAQIQAIQQAAQAQIQQWQEAAQARIERMQEALQKKLKGMQEKLQKQIKELEDQRAQPTGSESALTALQAQHDAEQNAKQLAELQANLAAAAPGTKEYEDATAALKEFDYQQTVETLQKQAEAERKAQDDSIQAKEDELTQKEQKQEESLTKQEQAEEAQIQKSLQARIDALNAATEAQAAALQAQEAAAEQEYQDERDAQRQILEDELADHLQHLLDRTETWDDFMKWLQGKNATGIFGKFLSPVIGAALAGDSQGKAFYNSFIYWLGQAASAYNKFWSAVQSGDQAPTSYGGGSGPTAQLTGHGDSTPGGRGGFATGGKIPGRFVGREDTVMARVTPGEYVIDRRLTAALEDAIVHGRGGSGKVELHVHGPFLGGTERQVYDALGRAVQPSLDQIIRYRSPLA